MIKLNFTCNVRYITRVFHGLTSPNRKFKVAMQDGSTPYPRSTMTIRQVLMDMMIQPEADHPSSQRLIISVIPIMSGEHAGSSHIVHLDDARHRRVRGQLRTQDGPITARTNNMGDYPADYVFQYMINVLGWTTGTAYSALGAFADNVRATVEDSTWDPATMLVSSPIRSAVNGDRQYIEQTTAEMEAQSGDVDFDLSQLLEDKERIDNEEEQREKLLRQHQIYEDLDGPRVGASGATVRTGVSAVSSLASSLRSTNENNIEANYKQASLKLSKQRGICAALMDALQKAGIDTNAILAGLENPSSATAYDPVTSNETAMDVDNDVAAAADPGPGAPPSGGSQAQGPPENE